MTLAFSIFRLCALYLSDAGWRRDGDDPGVWQDRDGGEWRTIGEALIVQWERDGVSPAEVAGV